MRGAKPAPLQSPVEGLVRIGREATDLFLTASLILSLGATVLAFNEKLLFAQEYTVLGLGLAAYLLSRFQKKADVFFLAVVVIAFRVGSQQGDLWLRLSMAWAVCVGIAIFQACFLGLRYKLLFSDVPASMKGWPILCLLAGFISVVLWSLGSLVF